MKYTVGGLISDGRGSVGGITFSKNHNAPYIRRRTIPHDPHSLKQMSVRALSAWLSKSWRMLSRSQTDAWAALAATYPRVNKLNQTYYLSGFQMYCHLNRFLQGIGVNPIGDAPSISNNVVPSLSSFSVEVDTTVGNLDIKILASPAIGAIYNLLVYSCGIVSPGIYYPVGFKKIGFYNSNNAFPFTILSDYLKVFGQMPKTGDVLFFKAMFIHATEGWQGALSVCRSIGAI